MTGRHVSWWAVAGVVGVLALAGGLVVGVTGCASGKKQAAEPSTGLDALSQEKSAPTSVDLDDRSDDQTKRKLDLMAAALANRDVSVDSARGGAGGSGAGAGESSAVRATGSVSVLPEDEVGAALATDGDGGGPVAGPAAVDETDGAGEAKAKGPALVEQLAAAIRARAAGESDPKSALLQLAALELLQDGGASLASEPDEQTLSRLTAREREFLKAWRRLFAQTRDSLAESGDVAGLARSVGDLAARLSEWEPLAVAACSLATRVDGFGMFQDMKRTPGGAYEFVAGRSHKAVVYVEVAGHTFSPKTREGVDGYEVSLTQDLRLFHASKDQDLLAWQQEAAPVTDFSRKRRREFYITQIIELPRTLTVGSYLLKVTLTDRANEASAEAVIPIHVVADASALTTATP